MAQTFAHHLGGLSSLDPGQYAIVGLGVVLRCPSCGGIYELDQDVDRGGYVARRQACPFVSCPWADWVVLESYLEAFDTSDVKR